jgi:hypothetical protein
MIDVANRATGRTTRIILASLWQASHTPNQWVLCSDHWPDVSGAENLMRKLKETSEFIHMPVKVRREDVRVYIMYES